ncbi:MAG: lysozyme inhibitor LprI family protein [Terriglobales bacterium]|jgi:uncharacterized protein YecT (DUF1311 family)
MKTVVLFLLFPFFPSLVIAQQPAPTQSPCEEKPISQRQMDDCAAFEYTQADLHLNNVYRKAVQYMTDDLARAQMRGDQKQFCRQTTPKTIQQMQTYAWDSKAALRGEEKPLKIHDHCPDARRYFAKTEIQFWRLGIWSRL